MMYVRSMSMRMSLRAARCGDVELCRGIATENASVLLSSAANANRAKDISTERVSIQSDRTCVGVGRLWLPRVMSEPTCLRDGGGELSPR